MAKIAKAAAPAKAAPAKAKAVAAAEPEAKESRYIGATTGLRVAAYQNQSLVGNEKRKLTDEALAEEWREEFPKAKAFDEATVRTVRNLYNLGKHKNDAPAKPLHGYDESGAQVPNRGEGKAEKAAAVAKPAKAAVAAPAASNVKKFAKAKVAKSA